MRRPGVLCRDPRFRVARSPHQRTKERDRDFSQFTWDSGTRGPRHRQLGPLAHVRHPSSLGGAAFCYLLSSHPLFLWSLPLTRQPFPRTSQRGLPEARARLAHQAPGSRRAGLSVPFRNWGVLALAVPTRGLCAQAASVGSGPVAVLVPLLGWAWGWCFRVGRNRCLHVGRMLPEATLGLPPARPKPRHVCSAAKPWQERPELPGAHAHL